MLSYSQTKKQLKPIYENIDDIDDVGGIDIDNISDINHITHTDYSDITDIDNIGMDLGGSGGGRNEHPCQRQKYKYNDIDLSDADDGNNNNNNDNRKNERSNQDNNNRDRDRDRDRDKISVSLEDTMDRGYEVLKVEPARMKVEETLTILTLILCILPTATAHMQTFFLADSHREIENMDIESLYVHACVCVCDVNGLYWGAYISISLYLYTVDMCVFIEWSITKPRYCSIIDLILYNILLKHHTN